MFKLLTIIKDSICLLAWFYASCNNQSLVANIHLSPEEENDSSGEEASDEDEYGNEGDDDQE